MILAVDKRVSQGQPEPFSARESGVPEPGESLASDRGIFRAVAAAGRVNQPELKRELSPAGVVGA